jgi:hypothetical protein
VRDKRPTLIALTSFVLEKEDRHVKVTANMNGFDATLENLKALVEGKEISNI